MAATLMLLVAGGLIVVADFTVDGFDLISDVAGYVLVAISGARLAGQLVADPAVQRRLRQAGLLTLILGIMLACNWLATTVGIRPNDPDSTGSAWFWVDSMLLAATAVAAFLYLTAVGAWCTAHGLERSGGHARLSAYLVAGTWGALTILGSVHAAAAELTLVALVLAVAAAVYATCVLVVVSREARAVTQVEDALTG